MMAKTKQHPALAPAPAPAPAPKIAAAPAPAPAPAAPAPKSKRKRRGPVVRLVASMAYARKTLTAAERHSRASDGWAQPIGEYLAQTLDALGDAQREAGKIAADWQPMRKARGRKAAAPIEIGSTVVFRPKVAAKYAGLELPADVRFTVANLAAGLAYIAVPGGAIAVVTARHLQRAEEVQS